MQKYLQIKILIFKGKSNLVAWKTVVFTNINFYCYKGKWK